LAEINASSASVSARTNISVKRANVTGIEFVWQFKWKFANMVVSRIGGVVSPLFPEATASNISTAANLFFEFIDDFSEGKKLKNSALDSVQDVA